jgi:hypothetical protein
MLGALMHNDARGRKPVQKVGSLVLEHLVCDICSGAEEGMLSVKVWGNVLRPHKERRDCERKFYSISTVIIVL